jgi:DNA-binding transcriptional MerR regulator
VTELKTNGLNQYSIRDLEIYSGIKAHTIRIWEKRYQLLEPERTDTNIRLYDDDQLRKLLNTVTLLENGWKISRISELSDDDLMRETQQFLDTEIGSNYTAYINALVQHMLDFDEFNFNDVLSRAIGRIGLRECMVGIVYPFLVKVGMLWRTKETTPAEEHFASNIIKTKLFAALNQQLDKRLMGSSFMLFLPQDENHEIGLLLASYLLRLEKRRVIYLGQDVPLPSLEQAYRTCKPQFLLTFIFSIRSQEEIVDYLTTLSQHFKESKILVSGYTDPLESAVDLVNLKFLHHIEDLKKYTS